MKGIEEELETVGENMKNLESSAEKALEREEKLVEKILSLQNKYKITEARFEYFSRYTITRAGLKHETFVMMIATLPLSYYPLLSYQLMGCSESPLLQVPLWRKH